MKYLDIFLSYSISSCSTSLPGGYFLSEYLSYVPFLPFSGRSAKTQRKDQRQYKYQQAATVKDQILLCH